MAYVTFDEFKILTGKNDYLEEDFNSFLPKATAILDNITDHFYRFNDINEDPAEFRVNQFKQALCAQIDYFKELGADTYESINNSPQSFSVGRTTVNNPSRYNPSGENESKRLLAEDVYLYLEGTGLLYRGVSS